MFKDYKKGKRIRGLDKILYAMTPETQMRGLMGVYKLPQTTGMLFVFDPPRRVAFHMRNTYIPLDICFADEDGIIFEMQKLYPHDETKMISSQDCKYALEVNRDWFSLNGYKVGDQLFDK